MSQSKCDEVDKMLDAYIYDYLVKQQLYETARIFHDEAEVVPDVVRYAPDDFLFEWWSVFWELFMAKRGLSQSEPAVSYLKAQGMRKQEEKRRILFVSRRPAQQQKYGAETQVVNDNVLCSINNGRRQNWVTSNATKRNRDMLKPPLHGNALDEMRIKKMKTNNTGQLPIEHCALFNAVAAMSARQTSRQTFRSAFSILKENLQQDENQNQQLPGSIQGMTSNKNPMMGFRTFIHINHGGSNLTRKRRPLAELDQLHSELLQEDNLMLSSQSSNQFSPQQQLMLQAQQDLVNPFLCGFVGKRPRVLLNNQNIVPGKDGQSNYFGDSIPNIVTPAPIGFSELPYLVNIFGTANTTRQSFGSPSPPSMQTPLPTWQQNDLSSPVSTQTQWDNMDHHKSDVSVGDNFEALSCFADADQKGEVDNGFSFKEIKHGMASSHKVSCCHFSLDGKLLVTGGHDNKASLWCTESFNLKSTLHGHSKWITDVRFSPSMLCVATSSADKTVKVWGVNNPSHSIRTFTGHTRTVMSLDFHPKNDDLICSCDQMEIRYWSIENGSCVGVFKGGATQVRFQPGLGKLLAAAVNNLILILDAETLCCRIKLLGHNSIVHSVCWHSSGKYLASVSDDLVRIWDIGANVSGVYIHELDTAGSDDKIKSCVFHPIYHVLILGRDETLMLWDYIKRNVMFLRGHDELVSALAVSKVTGLVASVSHDKHFKIWM
ncbi:transcriptional corepressor LEUNIG-like isoform X1 [Vicia villosa]|uniref:transcriptional corepressor LEUNIG-like isoform X1 n=1 Tax=Vicia villosa TaxID=3911 RepID=UPI00273B676A|nr:transcriptional corepressor LEUNIG-like isoform X1 [Vicia villosa]